MNTKYIYDNGKIKVYNESGIAKQIEYYDNIDEILIKENVIEQMELEYKKLNEKLSKHRFNIGLKKLSNSIFILALIPSVLIVLPLIFGYVNLASIPLLGYIGALGIPSILLLFLICQYNKDKNIKNATKAQLYFLKQNLSLETENLNKLKKDKAKNKAIIQVSVEKRVDDINELKRLRYHLLLAYNYGYNFKYYTKHEESRMFLCVSNNQYPEAQTKAIEENLNDGPTLIR